MRSPPENSAAPNDRLPASTDDLPEFFAQSGLFALSVTTFCELLQVATYDWIVTARDAPAHYMFLLGGDPGRPIAPV
jgi:hypothetical protein